MPATWTNPATPVDNTTPWTAAYYNTNLRDNELFLKLAVDDHGQPLVVPPWATDQRVALQLPVPPGIFADALVTTTATNGTLAAVWDATIKAMFTRFQITVSGGVADLQSVYQTSTLLCPTFTVGQAHVDSATNIVRMGLADGPLSVDPTNGIFFRSTNGGNWYAVVRKAGTETQTDTSVGSSTTPREFRIEVGSSTSITFYINGTNVRNELGTNIPLTTTLLGAALGFSTSGAGTLKTYFSRVLGLSDKYRSS